MTVRCAQCEAATVWDDSVGSAVCTACGSLTDPSQSVLTSSQYINQNDTSEPSLWDSSASITLKSLRAGNNWDLAGQGKESRDRKNMYAMAEFIKSLAVSLNAPGLSPRVVTLFNQAKAVSNFRWGQKSRSVAAACLAIALRESNRPDSLRDIASILKIPPTSVSREFIAITTSLKLSLTLVDPSVHISTLQNHLSSSLKEHQPESGLPSSLVKSLGQLCLRSASRTAVSLSQVLTRLSPEHAVLRLPVPPTACGIFILALEAENRALLNPLADLAQCLGSRCHAAKSVVMARYKTVQDEIATWVEKVPWLDKYESKNGRAKVSKRMVVARGLKDVIQFQEDIWRQQQKTLPELELSDEEEEDNESSYSLNSTRSPRKRAKLNHALTQATRFLLDPLGSSYASTVPHTNSKSAGPTSESLSSSHLPLATYILLNSSTPLARRPPTRLQLLAQDRGGVTEDKIPDEDLFAEGEFEKLLRNEDEIIMLQKAFGWDESEDSNNADGGEAPETLPRKPRKKRAANGTDPEEDILTGSALRPRKKSRLNMEALAQFLAGDNDDEDGAAGEDGVSPSIIMGLEEAVKGPDDDDEMPNDEEEDEDEEFLPNTIQVDTTPSPQRPVCPSKRCIPDDNGVNGEVIVDQWRPPTPEPAGGSDSRYEEEHPP